MVIVPVLVISTRLMASPAVADALTARTKSELRKVRSRGRRAMTETAVLLPQVAVAVRSLLAKDIITRNGRLDQRACLI